MIPGMTFLRETQSPHPRVQNYADLGKTGRVRSPKPSRGQEPRLGNLLLLCSPSHLLLHFRISEVQGQEVEVLRLLPLSGVRREVRREVASTTEDGGGRGRTGGGGREGLSLGKLPTSRQQPPALCFPYF